MGTVSIAIVNDYPVVVAGLDRMLEPFVDRVRVVELVVDQAPSQPVDVILYDTFAGPQPPDEVLEELLSQDAAGRVVLYTWSLQTDLVAGAIQAGFAAYVDKASSAEEIVAAIERVAAGDRGVVVRGAAEDPTTVPGETHVENRLGPPPGRWPGMEQDLSPCESEVVALITQGLSNQDITERAYLSINTVKTYIRSAYLKMGVTTRSQAVRWGMLHGMEHGADDREVEV